MQGANEEGEHQSPELVFNSLDLSRLAAKAAASSNSEATESDANNAQPRRRFDSALRVRQREEQAKVNLAMREALEQRRKSLPPEFRLSNAGRVSVKGTQGSTAVFAAVIERVLSSKGATQTQTAIRDEVQAAFPSHNVPKGWNVSLPAWAINQIKTRCQCSGAPLSSLRIPSKPTLASLHRAAKAAWQQHHAGAIVFKANVMIASDTLTIDGLAVAVSTQRGKGRTYRYARVSIDKLLEKRTG